MLDEDPVWIWRGNRDYGSGNFLVHAPGTAWAGHWAVPIREHRSWQTGISNCALGNLPQLMLRCHVVCGLDREQWSQHHEFVETNIGRTLPQTYTTVVAIQLFDTIRQVSENGE